MMIHYWSLISALVKVHVTEFCFKRDRVTEFCFLTHRYRLQSWTCISFLSYDIIAHLPIVEVFCQQPLFPLSFFSPQLCRQSDNPEHSIKGPLIDTRSVQETQHAYKSILLFHIEEQDQSCLESITSLISYTILTKDIFPSPPPALLTYVAKVSFFFFF